MVGHNEMDYGDPLHDLLYLKDISQPVHKLLNVCFFDKVIVISD